MVKKLSSVGDKCSGCFACVTKCPNSCIAMKTNNEGFWYPEIDEEKCVSCGLCEKICPVMGEKIIEQPSNESFAVINKNDKTRMESSSGGVFTLLAERVLDDNGVVFGAAFSDDFKSVQHICVKDKNKLWRLRGSKYLQSSIGDAYIQAENYLKQEKNVLFSGTPCQVAGLYAYLGTDYENLITQDIICHGVPSPLVWRNYVEYREHIAGSATKGIFFRHKKNGWKTYSLQFDFENDSEYIQPLAKDLYMRGFLANLYLRPSCYQCGFKSENRISDITLADFWGVENICPEMFDDRGTSLVLINTNKGKVLFNTIKSQTQNCDVEKSEALKYNSAATKSSLLPQKRKLFMDDIQTKPFSKIIKKYCRESIVNRSKRFVKKCLLLLKILKK